MWAATSTGSGFLQYTDPGLVDSEGITSGSDGNIWFTDTNGHQIGKLDISPNLGIGVLHLDTTLLKATSYGAIRINAPGGITGLSSSNRDFHVPDPGNLGVPPNLNVDCPPTCFVSVAFTPRIGSPIHDETSQLQITLATGAMETYNLTGSVSPPGKGMGWEHNH